MKILLFMVIAVSRFGVFLSNLYNYNLGYVSPFAVRVISSAADKGSVVNVANPIVDSLIYILRAAAFGGVGIILYIQKLKKELDLKLSINVLMMLNCALGTVWTLVVLIACLR